MRRVFVDNSYLVAILNPKDNRHQKATEISQSLGNYFSVTSEMVLTEFLNYFCARGSSFRQSAITVTDRLRDDPSVKVLPQTTEQFEQARLFYRKRLDKGYSLTDCVSILIMKEMRIQDVLTHDRHFQQEGFCALLRDS